MAIGRIPEPGTGIPESIIAAKGDILTGTANDTPAVLTAGTNETRLVADSGEATGLKYVADTTNYAVAAKGDLLVGTAADTLAPLTVGANDTVLTADSSEATGLKWAAVAGGGMTSIASGNFSGAGSSLSITGIPSGYVNLYLVISNLHTTGGSGSLTMRINANTNNADYGNIVVKSTSVTTYTNEGALTFSNDTSSTANNRVAVNLLINNYADTTAFKSIQGNFYQNPYFSDPSFIAGGFCGSPNAVTSIQVNTSGGTYAGGTYNLYGVK
jgi:hypothetical protein